ncbi:type II secretion system F family protein [Sphingomonas sp. PB4P5]|uniref:type II secretion system F family protein n=1 Tax=Parasphingomonas puruogangriensis TaxID=3096155 RepID=UPI002FCA1567
MEFSPFFMLVVGASIFFVLIAFALAGPSPQRAQARRLSSLRARHAEGAMTAEAQLMRRITTSRATKADGFVTRLLPRPALLKQRLAMSGKSWTLGQYGIATAIITIVVTTIAALKGLPILLAVLLGLALGGGLPHFVVSYFIKRRVGQFTTKLPDAIELLVRGLRSGLPITETIGVVGNEMDGPIGAEFRAVNDKMKIGRTLDAALQETADRLGTPEFQFFVISIAIQRETGGNLAETLANLANVLRMRGQMKLKIKAMSSESKASAYIIGALPFIVFGLIWFINGTYMQKFFEDERLMAIGGGGLCWMAIGAFIMSRMISFEI